MANIVDVYEIRAKIEGSKSIGELEKGIQNIKKELKDKDVGSKEFKELSRELQNAETRMGDMVEVSRNAGSKVGGAFSAAGKTIEAGFKGAMGASMMFASGSEEAIKLMGQLQGVMALKEGVAGMGQAVRQINLLTGGLGGASKAANALRLALISTGIGAIIILLGSLVAWFTKTTEGMEKLRLAMNTVQGVFSALIDTIIKFGAAMVKFLSGDFVAGINGVKEAFSETGEQIKENIKLAEQLTDVQNKLLQHERDTTKQLALNNKEIAEARELISSETASIEEKTKALEVLEKKALDNFNIEKNRHDLLIMQLELRQKMGTNTINDDIEMQKLVAQGIELETKKSQLEKSFNRDRNRVNAEQKAAERERQQAFKDNIQKQIDLERRRLTVLGELSYDKEKNMLDRMLKSKIVSREEHAIQVLELRKKYDDIEQKEQDQLNKDRQQKELDDLKDKEQAKSEQKAALELQERQRELELINQRNNGIIETDEEYEAARVDMQRERFNARLAMAISHGEDITGIQIEQAQFELEQIKIANAQKLQEEQNLQRSKMALLQDGFQMAMTLGQALTNNEAQQMKVRKIIGLAEIGTDTALAISAAVKNSEGNPLNALTGGGAGAIQFASSMVRIAANVGKAISLIKQKSPSVGGLSGGGGGGSASTFGNATPMMNISETIRPPQQQRVYVVESDITAMQTFVSDVDRVSVID